MSIAKTGDQVAVHYTGKHTDGSIFDSSVGGTPLDFQLGSGMVIKGFDDGVTGMTIGEKKTIVIPAADDWRCRRQRPRPPEARVAQRKHKVLARPAWLVVNLNVRDARVAAKAAHDVFDVRPIALNASLARQFRALEPTAIVPALDGHAL